MNRRIIALLLALLLISPLCALAAPTRYTSPTDEIEIEEIQKRLVALGYLSYTRSKAPSDEDVYEALLAFEGDHSLTDAPTADIELIPPRTVVRLFQTAADAPTEVWVPVAGGKKYHSKPTCSQMDDPEPVGRDVATELGFTPCKRCKP